MGFLVSLFCIIANTFRKKHLKKFYIIFKITGLLFTERNAEFGQVQGN